MKKVHKVRKGKRSERKNGIITFSLTKRKPLNRGCVPSRCPPIRDILFLFVNANNTKIAATTFDSTV
jgi:hypothetical protein